MQPDYRVESRSYDQMLRGSWHGYRLDVTTKLSDEDIVETTSDCVRLWLPAGTPMHWTNGTHPLRYNCLQYYWPQRWYTFSSFYEDRSLIHTYASIIKPATFELEQLYYIDLDLSVLVKPDLTYEVLTQAEFDELADTLRYDEETHIGALMAMGTLTNAIQLGVGLFATIPHTLRQVDFHLATCSD
jgi:protein associated with RNAse G/E